jgi:hypothetical protein
MKQKTKLQQWILSALFGLTLAASTSVGLSQATDWIQTFDTSGSTGPWDLWWGIGSVSWNSTYNNTTNVAGSGSMQLTEPFVGASGEQFMWFAGFHYGWQWDGSTVLDCRQYTNIIFDIMIDPSTAPAVNGTDFGTLNVGFVPSGWNNNADVQIGSYTIPLAATSAWQHVVMPINPTTAGINAMCAWYLDMWSNGHLTNTWNAYIDNLELQATPTNIPPPPPPTLSLTPATPGLNLFSTTTSGGNGRQSIRTATNGYSFYNSPNGTTYSVNIKKYPTGASYINLQTHMFLVPTSSMQWGPNDTSVDWNCTNMFFIQIANNADGTAYAHIMWKTNLAGGGWGTQIFGANNINAGSTTILGTWSLNIKNNTNITFTTPSASTNFSIDAATAAYFNDPNGMYAYFGMQPNNSANVGQEVVLAEASVTGGVDGSGNPSATLDDTFATAPLNTTNWAVDAADPSGVVVVGSDAPYWLLWTLPDVNFTLAYNANAAAPAAAWNDPNNLGAKVFQIGTFKTVLVDVPPTGQLYYQLVKRVATQLQVLLPGETNAPGAATGKIGTPLPQTVGNPFNLVINACDSTWDIVTSGSSSSDTVAITSSDTGAWVPAINPTLVNGTVTVVGNFYFGDTGTWTVTATDQPPGTLSPGVSTPITISQ